MTVAIVHKPEMLNSKDNDTCCTECCPQSETQTTEEDYSALENIAEDIFHNVKYHKPVGEQEEKRQHEFCYEKARQLLSFDDAPEYLKHNTYITSGYRGILNTKLCIESVFWWTNETINIWSHLFGWMLFIGLSISDLMLFEIHVELGDKVIVGVVLICFQVCMALSSLYHTFSCRSEKDFRCFLSFDLFGIALSLLAIYTSGIFYAFWCQQDLQNFYLISVTVIFIIAMVLQVPKLNVNVNIKMFIFVAWAVYGVVPTLHWTIQMGGLENPVVSLLLPRVLGMYLISGTAFAIYISKIPERFFAGTFNYIGHSHNWWHIFVLIALYYWHNTGVMYVEYRLNHACPDNMRIP